MNTNAIRAIARESINWSIGLSVAMILLGLLALAAPLATGIAVTAVLAWGLLLLGVLHFWFAWHTRGTREPLVGVADRSSLLLRRRLSADTPVGWTGHTDASARHVPAHQRRRRDHWKPQRPGRSGNRVAAGRWGYLVHPCVDDLVSSSIERGVDHRNSDRILYSLQRFVALVPLTCGSSGNEFHLVSAVEG
jgi:hypothetical protein